jgi:TolB protein
MNADGTGDRAIMTPAAMNIFPFWSRDGKRLVFTSGAELKEAKGLQVCIVNADGSGFKALPIPKALAVLPSWSPDGKEIAFSGGEQESQPEVYICDADGNGMRRVSPEGSGGFFAFWAPDGKSLFYTRLARAEGRKAEMVRLTLDGGAEEVIVSGDGKMPFGNQDSISPDGKKLLYVLLDEGNKMASVVMRDLATKGDTYMGDFSVEKADGPEIPLPAWAPDGKSFLMRMATDKGQALFKVSEDGKTKTRLTPEGVDCLGGSWSRE